MSATEGVIQFQLEFKDSPAPAPGTLHELNAWRKIFKQLGLLGQDPARYDGFGFGNLSRRAPNSAENQDAFIISGTQTGGLGELRPEDYVTVLACDAAHNRVKASGPIKPSSESLVHGLLYQTDPAIAWVMHLHSPDIFTCQKALDLPVTAHHAGCGTPQLAEAVVRLHTPIAETGARLLVMGGHEDGILAYGTDPHMTGGLAVMALAQALQSLLS